MSWEPFERPGPGKQSTPRAWIVKAGGSGTPTLRFSSAALELVGFSPGPGYAWLIDRERAIVAITKTESAGWHLTGGAHGSAGISAGLPRDVLGSLPFGAYDAERFEHEGQAAIGLRLP